MHLWIQKSFLPDTSQIHYNCIQAPKWYSIREFSVTTRPLATFVYTNVDAFEEYQTDIYKTTAGIPEIEGNLTLKSGEYIGMAFTEAREITSLTADFFNHICAVSANRCPMFIIQGILQYAGSKDISIAICPSLQDTDSV